MSASVVWLHVYYFWWTGSELPDDMIRCYSLYTSSGNINQLPALMWLDLHAIWTYILACHAVFLAKLNTYILEIYPHFWTYTYILNIPTYFDWLTGSTYYVTFQRLELYWTRLSLVIMLFTWSLPFSCWHCITPLSSSVAAANITFYHRRWTDYDIRWRILTLYTLFMGYIYQLLYSPNLFSSVLDTLLSSSVLLVRISRQMFTNSDTSDMISHFYAGLDYCSQICHIRRILLLLLDLSYSAGHGYLSHLWSSSGRSLTANSSLTTTPGYLTYRFLAYGICYDVVVVPQCTTLNLSTSGRL